MLRYLRLIMYAFTIQLYSLAAHATDNNEAYLKYGLGINTDGAETKNLALGYDHQLYKLLDYQLEAGVFKDNTDRPYMIGYASGALGISAITTSGLYAKFFIGPGFVSNTDSRLSSIFEFNHDLELGIKGKNGVGVGVDYHHMSNAGTVPPNPGRDFFNIKLTMPM